MRYAAFMEKIFALDEAAWARHANPWSVWTRFTVLPLLIAAFWSRLWLGWYALCPIALAVLWMWLNPRLFAPPTRTDGWASKAVLGERLWLDHKTVPIPPRHRVLPHILSTVAAIGLGFVIWGVSIFAIWPTLLGMALIYCGKLWLLDRMVWLYEDMTTA